MAHHCHSGLNEGLSGGGWPPRAYLQVPLGMACLLGLLVLELVRAHACKAQHRVMTSYTVVVRLLQFVIARLLLAVLGWRVLLESGRSDAVHLVVVPPMCDHFVGVRTHVGALETMKV